jgi:hypothetical protein
MKLNTGEQLEHTPAAFSFLTNSPRSSQSKKIPYLSLQILYGQTASKTVKI